MCINFLGEQDTSPKSCTLPILVLTMIATILLGLVIATTAVIITYWTYKGRITMTTKPGQDVNAITTYTSGDCILHG